MGAQRTPAMPDDMASVSRDDFFRLLSSDRRDIMPRHEARDYTSWEVQHTRARWGWSTPGWENPGAPKSYAVSRAIARAAQP